MSLSVARRVKRILPNRVIEPLSFTAKLPPVPIAPTTKLATVVPPALNVNKYSVSANYIKFPKDVQATINLAKRRKKQLDLFALYLDLSGSIDLRGIPSFRVFAHTCVLSTKAVIINMNALPLSRTRLISAAIGVTPRKAQSGNHAGHIDIVCKHIKSRVPAARLQFSQSGGAGKSGAAGGRGRNGIDGKPGHRGRCKKRKVLGVRVSCKRRTGHAGVNSTPGKDGTRGGSGGNGGNGGNLSLTYEKLDVRIVPFSAKGFGAIGGVGGAPGRNGKFIENIYYVSRCSSKCHERKTLENRPKLTTPKRGPLGYRGTNGRDGIISIGTIFNPGRTSFRKHDFLRFIALAERYTNDLILSKRSCEESISVLDTIITVATYRTDIKVLQSLSQQAALTKKGILLRKGIFGPATLSRSAPVPIATELKDDIQYVEALKDQITSSKLKTDVLSVLIATTSISIPATSYNLLRRNLQAQRSTFERAVLDIEANIENALGVINFQVEDHVLAKRDAIEAAKKKALFKAVLSVVKIGVGVMSLDFKSIFGAPEKIIGAIKGVKFSLKDIKDRFGKIGKATDFKGLLKSASKISKNLDIAKKGFAKAEAVGCSFNDLKKLLVDAPDRVDKFPNLVDFKSDFSKIQDVGVVTDLSQALLQTRSSELTSQFSCVLGENLEDIPALKTAFENYFTLSGSRLEILGRMVDIDIEIQQLSVMEQGVQAQKDELKALQKSVRGHTKEAALAILSITFEYARMRAIETLVRLSSSYENLLLRDMGAIIISYAKKRLDENGALGLNAGAQYANLVKLEGDLKKSFRNAQSCFTSREIPSIGYYSFDITPKNNPALFSKKLRTGPDNRASLMLDISKNCAFYAGSEPPPRMLTNVDSRSVCLPNLFTYNARMSSISVEFIGGDEKLLPKGRTSVFGIIDQVGLQSFHAKPNVFRDYDMPPLQIPLGFLSVKTKQGAVLQYNPTCFAGDKGLGGVSIDSPRVCPSPFSAYMLQIGHVEEKSMHSYLNTIKAIRIHTRLVAYTSSLNANICVP